MTCWANIWWFYDRKCKFLYSFFFFFLHNKMICFSLSRCNECFLWAPDNIIIFVLGWSDFCQRSNSDFLYYSSISIYLFVLLLRKLIKFYGKIIQFVDFCVLVAQFFQLFFVVRIKRWDLMSYLRVYLFFIANYLTIWRLWMNESHISFCINI